MQPGDQITCSERWFLNKVEKEPLIRRGSVGCFLSSGNGQSRVDYFTTALHVTKATMGEDTLVVDIFDASKATQGKIFAESEDALDASLVQIVLGSALQQGANRLPGVQVNGQQLQLTDVWDPSETLRRLKSAPTAADEEEIKQEKLSVSHLGGTLASQGKAQIGVFNGEIQYGLVQDNTRRLKMTKRTTYPGDSGGPVFTQEGLLVGFIRTGGAKVANTETDVTLAYYVFEWLRGIKQDLRLT